MFYDKGLFRASMASHSILERNLFTPAEVAFRDVSLHGTYC
jgi:hypothetical protein